MLRAIHMAPLCLRRDRSPSGTARGAASGPSVRLRPGTVGGVRPPVAEGSVDAVADASCAEAAALIGFIQPARLGIVLSLAACVRSAPPGAGRPGRRWLPH